MFVDVLLGLVLVICLYTDIKERRIYNKVLFPAWAAGTLYHVYTGGWPGLAFSLQGLGLGLVMLLLPFVLGGMGAGDVKLMALVGALQGPQFVFLAFLGSALAGGLIALVLLLKEKKLLAALRRIGLSLYMGFLTRFKVNTLDSLDKQEYSQAFPYGVAITLGTVAAYMVR